MTLAPLISCTGGPAQGEDQFFYRKEVIAIIKRKLNRGENLLITAPRRIGKTSILKYLSDNPEKGQIIKYLIVQSVETPEQFYKRLMNVLIDDDDIFSLAQKVINKSSKAIRSYTSRIKNIKLMDVGIELSDANNINYFGFIIDLFNTLSTSEKKIIIFLDEFPDAISNISKLDKSKAITFLQQHREIRETFKNSNLQFVYTGSSGLKHVVHALGESHLLNNIDEITLPPLSNEEAKQFLQRLILGKQKQNKSFTIDEQVVDSMLNRVSWLLPYYLQIILDELFELYLASNKLIDEDSLDIVFANLVKANSNHSQYFEHWKSRLSKSFQESDDYKLAINLLNALSKTGRMEHAEFNNIANIYTKADRKFVIQVMQHDGYIQIDDDKSLGFNSVLLRQWWFINVAT